MRGKTIKRKNLESTLKKSLFQEKFCLEEITPVYPMSQNESIFEDIFYSVNATHSSQVIPSELQAYIQDAQTIVLEEGNLMSVRKPEQEIYYNSKRIKRKL